VQKNHHRTIGGADFGVGHVQQPSVDMLKRAEGVRLESAGAGHHWLWRRGLRIGSTKGT
jgi:hypothetical protein